MNIPGHKCTPYCKPGEGIHCLPNMWGPGATVDDFQPYFNTFEVLCVKEETDVTAELNDKAWAPIAEQDWAIRKIDKENNVGYLMWLREKAPA